MYEDIMQNTYVLHIYMLSSMGVAPDMGWLRLVGSLYLQVSIAEYSRFSKALVHKRPIISRSLLIVATPYVYIEHI